MSLKMAIAGALAALLLPAAAGAAQTPRRWAFSLHFGGYQPSIDEEPGIEGRPFASAFGATDRLATQLSLERLLFQKFGTIGVGGLIGYSEFYGNGTFATGEDAGEQSGDTTSLHVLPVAAYVAYRFDWPAQKLDVPVAPYGKLGLGYWVWWSTDGLGNTSGGGDASGARLGYLAAGGLMLHLDPFDPRLSVEFDHDYGVNDSFLFVEIATWQADGLGDSGFDLSDDTVLSFGLALEF